MKKGLTITAVIVLAALLALGGIIRQRAAAQTALEARVMAWEFTANSDDGQLEVLATDGTMEKLVDFPPGQNGNMAKWCGQNYRTPDGLGVALYTGSTEGDIAIYPVAGGTAISLGRAGRMACAGPLTFQFSPNGQRVGYLDYNHEISMVDRIFPFGNLVFFDPTTGTETAVFDWAVAFRLYDDGALMLRFYPDGKGDASEADLDWWDGSARKTLATLEVTRPADKPDLECSMTNGTVARLGDNAYMQIGQHCVNGSTIWRFISVPMAGGPATEIATGTPAGGFLADSFTAQLIPAKDGTGFLMTVPSGLDRNTVQLVWIKLDGSTTALLEGKHVLVDRFGEVLSEGRHLLLSEDGTAVAFVTTTGNNIQTLWMLDLTTLGGQPVSIQEQGANERIFHYVWAPGNTLYYAAGAVESDSLYKVQMGSTPQRVTRGRFFRLVTSAAGDKIAAAEWYANPNSIGDDLFQLQVLDLNGNVITLKQGDDSHNQIIPLAVQ